MKVEFLSAVLLVSKNHEKLAQFYREIIGIPLEDEEHDGTIKHFGCEMGDLHFAIHPLENFHDEAHGVGSVKLAFEVFDMDDHVRKLERHGVKLLYPPKKMGPMLITAIKGRRLDLGGDWREGESPRRICLGHRFTLPTRQARVA